MFRFALAVAAVLTLAACQSAEERAEEHYQSALALLAEGDLARATVEFRNVFELDGLHVEARRTFAQALRDGGGPAVDALLDRLLAGKPRRHQFDLAQAAPAVPRHMSVTGG